MQIDREPSSSAVHWTALDGLRGAAVAAVVAYHLGRINGGFLGVDLFFVLSGFLITALLLREHRTNGTIRLGQFWGRRFRRLLPAVAAMIGAVLAWLIIWGTPAEQAVARTDARWSLPYLANWHLISTARDYWAASGVPSAFTHLWSLAIEEQFYVVWPLVVVLALRRGNGVRVLTWITLAGAAASAAAMVTLSLTSSPSRVYFGTDTRMFALLVGAAMALPLPRRLAVTTARWHPMVTTTIVGVIAAVLAGSWFIGGKHLGFLVGGGLLIHSALAAIAVALLAASHGHAARVLSVAPLVWLGQRSYGLYLWHYPVIRLIGPRLGEIGGVARDVTVVAASVLLAEASYRLIEHPIRRRQSWALGRRATFATAALTVAAVFVAMVAPSGRGHVASFDVAAFSNGLTAPNAAATEADAVTARALAPVVPVALASMGPTPAPPPVRDTPASDAPVPTAEAGPSSDQTTVVGPTPASGTVSPGTVSPGTGDPVVAPVVAPAEVEPPTTITSVLWIGDSVAADIAPPVVAALVAAGVTITDASFDGARLVPTANVDTHAILDDLLAEHPSDLVVVQLSYWDSVHPRDVLTAELGRVEKAVRTTGADLMFVTPPPVRGDLETQGLRDQIAVAFELGVREPEHVSLIDTTEVWGPELSIDIDGDGAPDRKSDGVHVCPQGAARFATWFVNRVGDRYPGLITATPDAWIAGPWITSARFDTPVGACAALPAG